jgi:hypothetical protein
MGKCVSVLLPLCFNRLDSMRHQVQEFFLFKVENFNTLLENCIKETFKNALSMEELLKVFIFQFVPHNKDNFYSPNFPRKQLKKIFLIFPLSHFYLIFDNSHFIQIYCINFPFPFLLLP